MSDSSPPPSDDEPPQYVIDRGYAAIQSMLAEREAICKAIAKHANERGLDCDWQFVNKHLTWFKRWHSGMIATGYLMGRTGVKMRVTTNPFREG